MPEVTESWTTPGSYTWTVPSDIELITVDLAGGAGASGSYSFANGANGGWGQAEVPVTPGETLYIYVGGAASGITSGFPNGGSGRETTDDYEQDYDREYSGGGGGTSEIRQGGDTTDNIVFAAGGGGGAAGGAVRDDLNPAYSDFGGGGGGGVLTANDGEDASTDVGSASGGSGDYSGYNGDSGLRYIDTNDALLSGAGGGGVNGAGNEGQIDEGASNSGHAGGGGGGSGFVADSVTLQDSQVGNNSGDGYVEITYSDPNPPSNVSTSNVTYRSVTVSWDAASGAEEYKIYRDGTHIATVAAGTTSYDDTGLQPTTSYSWEVSTVEGGNESSLAGPASATTGGAAPSDVATSVSGDDVTITWTDTNDDEDGYEIYRGRSPSVGTSGSPIATTAADATSFSDADLLDGERYYYRVVAVLNGEQGNDSAEVDDLTELPAPTNLSASNVTADSVDLSWTANHDYGDTRVEFKPTDASSWTTDATVDRTAESHTLSGLRNGEAYDARVVAQTEHTETEDA